MLESLSKNGVTFISKPELSNEGIAKVCFCLDPNGIRVELVEMLMLMAKSTEPMLSVAIISTAIEVEVQLFLAEQIGYVQSPTLIKARRYCESISRMITTLKRAL